MILAKSMQELEKQIKYAESKKWTWKNSFIFYIPNQATPIGLSPLDVALLCDTKIPRQTLVSYFVAKNILGITDLVHSPSYLWTKYLEFRYLTELPEKDALETLKNIQPSCPFFQAVGITTSEEALQCLKNIYCMNRNVVLHRNVTYETKEGEKYPLLNSSGKVSPTFLQICDVNNWVDIMPLYYANYDAQFFKEASFKKPNSDAVERLFKHFQANPSQLTIFETENKGRCLRVDTRREAGTFLGFYGGYYFPSLEEIRFLLSIEAFSDDAVASTDSYGLGRTSPLGRLGSACHYAADGFPNSFVRYMTPFYLAPHVQIMGALETLEAGEEVKWSYGFQEVKYELNDVYIIDPRSLEKLFEFVGKDTAAFFKKVESLESKKVRIELTDVGTIASEYLEPLAWQERVEWIATTPKAILALFGEGLFSSEDIKTFFHLSAKIILSDLDPVLEFFGKTLELLKDIEEKVPPEKLAGMRLFLKTNLNNFCFFQLKFLCFYFLKVEEKNWDGFLNFWKVRVDPTAYEESLFPKIAAEFKVE